MQIEGRNNISKLNFRREAQRQTKAQARANTTLQKLASSTKLSRCSGWAQKREVPIAE